MALYTLKELKLFSIGKAATAEFEEVGRYRSPRPRMVSSASKTLPEKGTGKSLKSRRGGRAGKSTVRFTFLFFYTVIVKAPRFVKNKSESERATQD